MMKPIAYVFAILLAISLAGPVLAEGQSRNMADAMTGAASFGYDSKKEVTLKGTVTSVFTGATAGMLPGSHLWVSTSAGPVDASLGMFALRGGGALTVSAGTQVEATGVMKTIRGNTIFLVRTVRVDGEVYSVRNEHGVPISPQARKRANERAGQKGETL